MASILALIFSPVGRVLIIAVASVAAVAGAYLKGDIHGYNKGREEVRAEWAKATAEDIKRGEDARLKAEQYVAKPPSVFYRVTRPGSVPNDKWNRDKGAVRSMAPLNLLGGTRHTANGAGNSSTQHDGPAPRVLVDCAKVKWAVKNLPQSTLDYYQQHSTPEQKAAGEACLKGN